MSGIEVTTELGALRGQDRGETITWRAVPYAAPPLGSLRYAPPTPAHPWSGLRDATRDGPIPPQKPSRLAAAIGDFSKPQSEDCLFLTITAPAAPSAAPRPVLVYFHGGAYQACAGSLEWFDGAPLARRGDMVVVTANYRLGAIGFLRGAGAGSGRQGLDDMAAALGWVARNIAAFGGDPARVTAMGQSAGAHALMCLLADPGARALFQRVALLSAPASIAPFSNAHAARIHSDIVAALDAAGAGLDAPPAALLDAADAVARKNFKPGEVTPVFMPTIDALSDAATFRAAAARGAAQSGIDMLVGTTRDEGHAFFPGDTTGVSARITEEVMAKPARELARATVAAGGRAWLYEFAWAPKDSPFGACHCIELPFIFGTVEASRDAAMLKGADAAEMAALTDAMQDAWIAFVRGGDPKARAIAVGGRTAVSFTPAATLAPA